MQEVANSQQMNNNQAISSVDEEQLPPKEPELNRDQKPQEQDPKPEPEQIIAQPRQQNLPEAQNTASQDIQPPMPEHNKQLKRQLSEPELHQPADEVLEDETEKKCPSEHMSQRKNSVVEPVENPKGQQDLLSVNNGAGVEISKSEEIEERLSSASSESVAAEEENKERMESEAFLEKNQRNQLENPQLELQAEVRIDDQSIESVAESSEDNQRFNQAEKMRIEELERKKKELEEADRLKRTTDGEPPFLRKIGVSMVGSCVVGGAYYLLTRKKRQSGILGLVTFALSFVVQ